MTLYFQDDWDNLVTLRLLVRNERLVQASKNKGITQGQLAQQLRWNYPKLSRIVNLQDIASEEQKKEGEK